MHMANMSKGMMPAIAIVAGGIPLAAGMGLSYKMRRTDQVVACFFGDGAVDWSTAEGLRHKLDTLLKERRGPSLTITRITRLYEDGFIFLLKPDRHRFWTRSIALRDADDILADLRAQGF